jgi:glutamyl-tRNA reductase
VVIVSLSASHHDLDLDVLDRLSVGAGSVARELVAHAPSVGGAVVLATCNRFEVYLDVADAEDLSVAVDSVIVTVGQASSAVEDEVRGALRLRTGTDVARHLFSVASGLDSMVMGEREIAGQVRRAVAEAQAGFLTTAELDRLFGGAARVSRAVENEAGLGAVGRSIVGVALDLVAQHAPPWPHAKAVMIGTGSYAGASLAALRARGCTDVQVYSPSGRAGEFARARGVVPVAQGALVSALEGADVVVSCSGSLTPVLDAEAVASAIVGGARGAGPLVVVDLSLQRDVEPGVGDLPEVILIDLGTVREHAPALGDEQVARATALVAAAATDFEAALQERAVDHAVVALREHVLAAVEAEVARLPGGDVPAELVERALRRLAATLLHTPSVRARDAARAGRVEDYLSALRLLHGIEPPAS